MVNFKDLIKVGTVTAIFDEKGTVQINFEDKDDCTVEYPLLSTEYNMPKNNDPVWCISMGNGIESGLCLGKAYSSKNPPPVQDKNIYHKPLVDNEKAFFEYDNNTETLKFKAKHIIYECDDAVSTGELGDKKRFISADRTIYNGHTNINGEPPTQKM